MPRSTVLPVLITLVLSFGCDGGAQTVEFPANASPGPAPQGAADVPPAASSSEDENEGRSDFAANDAGASRESVSEEEEGEDMVGMDSGAVGEIAEGEGDDDDRMVAGDGAMVGEGAEMADEGGFRRPPRRPPTLRERALSALVEGKLDQALPLLRAHNVTDDSEETNYAHAAWFAYQRRPTQAVGWAIGVEVEGRLQANDDLKPAGSRQALPQRSRSSRRSSSGSDEEENEGSAGQEGGLLTESDDEEGAALAGPGGKVVHRELHRLTGDLGDEFLTRLARRIEDGACGEILREALDPQAAAAAGGEDREEEEGFEGEGAPAAALPRGAPADCRPASPCWGKARTLRR